MRSNTQAVRWQSRNACFGAFQCRSLLFFPFHTAFFDHLRASCIRAIVWTQPHCWCTFVACIWPRLPLLAAGSALVSCSCHCTTYREPVAFHCLQPITFVYLFCAYLNSRVPVGSFPGWQVHTMIMLGSFEIALLHTLSPTNHRPGGRPRHNCPHVW